MNPRPPDVLDRAWAAFSSAARGPRETRLGRTDLAGVAVLGALASCIALGPAMFVEDMGLDLFIQLDGAWRWAQGQRPHVDFFTPVGVLWYAVLGLGWKLFGGDPTLCVKSNLIVLPFAAVAAWVATRDRLPALPRVLLAVMLTTLVFSPRTLDSWLITGTATYNRWGWALSGIAITAVVLPPAGSRSRWPETLVVALSLPVLFFVKVTYVGLVVGAIGVAALLVPATRWTGLGGGAAGLAAVALSTLHPFTRAYLADVGRAAESASGEGLFRVARLADLVSANQAAIEVALVAAIALARTSRGEVEERDANRVGLAAVLVAAGAVAIGIQSHDKAVPALVLPVAMLFAAFHARDAPRPGICLPLTGVALCGLLAAHVGVEAQAIGRFSLPHADAIPMVAHGPGRRIVSPFADPSKGRVHLVQEGELSGFAFDNFADAAWAVDNPIILGDALDLIARHGLERSRIASLTFSMPFPYLLGSPPPRHLPAWLDWERTIGPRDAERMPQMLSDSDVVLVPKVWMVQGVHDVSEAALARDFTLRDETALWVLWVRR